MKLIIDGVGDVRCIYDEMIDLAALGKPSIMRASHVEPDEDGMWWADMSPVGGPKLGPFEKRSEALAAEWRWIQTHRVIA
ncbi:MAG: hypothetical protein WD768_03875 [Phycisphaeraceae bacterium]